MAASKAPTWKQAFDAAERAIGPRINELANSENFAIVVGLATRARREMANRSERFSRQFLHLANLPAGSDVNRLMAQIGKLEREVRELRNQLDDAADSSPPVRLAPRASASRASRASRSSRSSRAAAATVASTTEAASTTSAAGNGSRKVATNGVVRQPSRRTRQDSA
jgi:hypothetical protein